MRSRRDELLEQVIRMKIEFETKRIPLFENLRELEEMRVQIEKLTLKQNLAVKKQTESLADIDSEIEKLRVSLSGESSLKFNCSINQLIEQVILFGEFVDLSSSLIESHSKYSKKLTVGKIISAQYPILSKRLHIDYDNDLLYIFSGKLQVVMEQNVFIMQSRSFVCRKSLVPAIMRYVLLLIKITFITVCIVLQILLTHLKSTTKTHV